MKTKKKMIGWAATVRELRQIDELKTALKRNTTADLMRYLVMQEAERILPSHFLKKADAVR